MTENKNERSAGLTNTSMTGIRDRVDQLAMDAMLAQGNDSTPALLTALSEICAQAKAEGFTAIPALIGDMQEMLAANPGEPDAFLTAITHLQLIIEEGNTTSEPVANTIVDENKANVAPMLLSADPELLADFFVESRDHLISIENLLMTLERDPGNTDAIHSIFRGFHTIKGLAGFLEFPAIQAVAHEVETLLDKARNSQLSITSVVVDVVLEGADYLKTDIQRIERAAAGEAVAEPADNQSLLARIQARMNPAEITLESIPQLESSTVDAELLDFESPAPAKERHEPEAKAADPRKAAVTESRVLKVDTGKLDFLVDMVGELVIAQSMVRHDPALAQLANPRIQSHLAQLARITDSVQKTTMTLRMLPVRQNFPDRSIEDMTRELLRGLLKQWLDDNLPRMVEQIVREEIERVARRGR